MQPKTRELLDVLLWTADRLSRPTFRNMTESYESWSYSQGLLRQLATLEKQRLLERDRSVLKDRVYRLTEKGRLVALGGRDPEAQWSRAWDGRWRFVLFDVPIGRNSSRERLRRHLRGRNFGCLQQSVWITPDPIDKERAILAGSNIKVKNLLLVQARPCAGESDADIAAGAWDFEHINGLYSRHLKILEERPTGALLDQVAARALRRWAAEERAAWLAAVVGDPLLPERLLPPGYQGREAWRRRIKVLGEAGQQLRTFRR